MNPIGDDPILPFDDDACEREWLAQERAMRRERLRLDHLGDDARVLRYRMLARALRQPIAARPPADFARQVAALAGRAAGESRTADSRLESGLMIALAIVFATAAIVVTVMYGHAWLTPLAAVLPGPAAARWLLALGGCLGLSWLLGRWSMHGRPIA